MNHSRALGHPRDPCAFDLRKGRLGSSVGGQDRLSRGLKVLGIEAGFQLWQGVEQ